jgi:hypothetical protein
MREALDGIYSDEDFADLLPTREAPAAALQAQLQHLLRRGNPTTLLPEVIAQFQQRRAHAETIGLWVEYSYRL